MAQNATANEADSGSSLAAHACRTGAVLHFSMCGRWEGQPWRLLRAKRSRSPVGPRGRCLRPSARLTVAAYRRGPACRSVCAFAPFLLPRLSGRGHRPWPVQAPFGGTRAAACRAATVGTDCLSYARELSCGRCACARNCFGFSHWNGLFSYAREHSCGRSVVHDSVPAPTCGPSHEGATRMHDEA